MSAADIQLALVDSWSEAQRFQEWMREPHEWLSVDTETGGFDWWRDELRLVQIGDHRKGWAIPWQGWGGISKEAIEGYQGPIAMHNSKFDIHFLEHNGIQVPRHLLHDTMPMVALLEPLKPKGLKSASERHAFKGARDGGRLLQSVMDKNNWTWADIPVEVPEYWSYGALDTVLTSTMARNLYPKISATKAFEAYRYEVAVAQVLCDMEKAGLLLDVEHIEESWVWLDKKEDELRKFFREEMDISNPLSDKQLIDWFEKMGYVFTEFTDKGNTKLDKVVLEEIAAHRTELATICESITHVRNYRKIKKTYFGSFLELMDSNNRLHTSINPLGAITGRMSSSRPNLQNVPARTQGKMVRNAFIPSEGYRLVAADFDQIEYRIMVSRAGEQRLIEAIQAGQDLHTYMTSIVYDKPMEAVSSQERTVMKNATFAFLYGAGDAKFARMAGIQIDQAKSFREVYARQFPAINAYALRVDQAGQNGQEIETQYMGRKQAVRKKDGSYKLLNYTTQGEAGDVLKRKLVELSMTDIGHHMRLPIHDEILFEVPKAEVDHTVEVIRSVMPENDAFDVPLSVGVEVIDRWGDKYL